MGEVPHHEALDVEGSGDPLKWARGQLCIEQVQQGVALGLVEKRLTVWPGQAQLVRLGIIFGGVASQLLYGVHGVTSFLCSRVQPVGGGWSWVGVGEAVRTRKTASGPGA